METKHPFDAYVQLWEVISGNKEKKTPRIAAGKLEKMFTTGPETSSSDKNKNNNNNDDNNNTNKPKNRKSVVVLLDEIDYLVTAKQTESSCKNVRIFELDAIKFAAKKVAAISGDIRKAFQLCKVAAETVYSELESGKRELNPRGCISIRVE